MIFIAGGARSKDQISLNEGMAVSTENRTTVGLLLSNLKRFGAKMERSVKYQGTSEDTPPSQRKGNFETLQNYASYASFGCSYFKLGHHTIAVYVLSPVYSGLKGLCPVSALFGSTPLTHSINMFVQNVNRGNE